MIRTAICVDLLGPWADRLVHHVRQYPGLLEVAAYYSPDGVHYFRGWGGVGHPVRLYVERKETERARLAAIDVGAALESEIYG